MILVTGATGLLGSHLLYDLISAGSKIRATYRNKKNIQKTAQIFSYYQKDGADLINKIEWVKADVNDICQLEEVTKNVDEVFHCAAVVSFNRKDHKRIMKTNVEGTANLLEVSMLNNVSKFCHVSSIASFGRPEKKGNTIDESVKREEHEKSSVYSLSKYLAEVEVWRAIEEGLNAVIINPSTIIGSGNWKTGSSALFPRVWNGLSYYTEGVNGFVDVRDVVKIMMTLMDKNIFKEQYILVSEHLSFKDLLSFIAGNLNLKTPSIRANKLLSELAWRFEEIRCAISKSQPVITKESAAIALDSQFYSNQKIRTHLNLDFIPIKQSIQDTSINFLNPTSGFWK